MPHIPGGINLIVIMAVVLLVLGPEKLPQFARTVAKTMNEFRSAMHDVTRHFDVNDIGNTSHTPSSRALADPYDSTRASYASASYHPDPYHPESPSYHSGDEAGPSGGDPAGTSSPAADPLSIG